MAVTAGGAATNVGKAVVKGLSYLWLIAALIALWEWRGRSQPSLFIPAPSEIVERFREVWFSGEASSGFTTETFRHHVGASLSRWIVAYLIAAVVGVALGSFLARSRRVNLMCQPIIRLAQSTPSIMLLPLVIVLLGINDTMTMTVIVYGSFWPVLVNTIDGVSAVDPATINSARALRLRGFRLFRMVLLRSASPQILAGLRVALGVSIILMVGSELYAASEGVGYYVMLSQRTLQFTDMFAGILLAVLIGLVANGLFFLAEKRVLRWRPTIQES